MESNLNRSVTTIKSHVQMPRFLLKKFEGDNRGFYYYDVEKKVIGTNGFAKSTNRIKNYYSADIEELLNQYIEHPFSLLVRRIEKVDFGKESFQLSSEENKTIKLFFRSLIARSPAILKEIEKDSFESQWEKEKAQHDDIFLYRMHQAESLGVFDDYIITLFINKTVLPFVLSVSGMFNIEVHKQQILMLPVLPKVAVVLLPKNQGDLNKENNKHNVIFCEDEQQIINCNLVAFTSQCKSNWGRIVSSNKPLLERLMYLYNEKSLSKNM